VPELPEVETIRHQLWARILGRRVIDAWACANPKFTAAPAAIGARIEAANRRGKYLIAPLDDDRELIVHLGMTGILRICEGLPSSHRRAAWTLDDGAVLEYDDVRQFGRIAVVARGDYRTLPTLHALGPEPLSDDFTPQGFYKALRGHKARIKTQLLSQRPVAGVGNIYADEALWDAGINPSARQLSRPQAARLHATVRAALQKGVDNGGTTLRDYRTFEGGTGSNQHELACYGRAGEPCLRCGAELRRRVIDGRGTTLCPRCQRR